ncbi:MAG: hypothetical protein IPM18_06860 [Phycisphaerales bacterium]|nr:hypothetical protein [Phycisphaerales bacterium]
MTVLATLDDGSGPALYAGGFFTSAGGQAATRIARWNGTAWSPLHTGVNQPPEALALFEDGIGPAIYVGGSFQITGMIAASRLARWGCLPGSPATLYSNTNETTFRFHPGNGVQGTPRVAFDDVMIPDARINPGDDMLEVWRVTYGIFRANPAPATNANLYYASMSTGTVPPDTALDVPFETFDSGLFPATGTTGLWLITSGDGNEPLFTVPLNSTHSAGYHGFMLGLSLDNPNTNNGWRITQGPDANINGYWIYDVDGPFADPPTAVERHFWFGGTPPGMFYLTVVGRTFTSDVAAQYCPGDMNCDELVNFADISLFIAALKAGSPDNWTYDPAAGVCAYLNGDTNGDELVNFADISSFIAQIKANPEPCTTVLP